MAVLLSGDSALCADYLRPTLPGRLHLRKCRLASKTIGRRYGGSSGTNFVACLQLAARMRVRGERGSIVSLLCDRGERYDETLFDRSWLERRQLDPAAWRASLLATARDGCWHAPDGG